MILQITIHHSPTNWIPELKIRVEAPVKTLVVKYDDEVKSQKSTTYFSH